MKNHWFRCCRTAIKHRREIWKKPVNAHYLERSPCIRNVQRHLWALVIPNLETHKDAGYKFWISGKIELPHISLCSPSRTMAPDERCDQISKIISKKSKKKQSSIHHLVWTKGPRVTKGSQNWSNLFKFKIGLFSEFFLIYWESLINTFYSVPCLCAVCQCLNQPLIKTGKKKGQDSKTARSTVLSHLQSFWSAQALTQRFLPPPTPFKKRKTTSFKQVWQ